MPCRVAGARRDRHQQPRPSFCRPPRCHRLVGELGRIVQYEDRAISRGHSIPRRLKVAAEDLCFTDSAVVQESVSGLGVGPVLTGQRNSAARTG